MGCIDPAAQSSANGDAAALFRATNSLMTWAHQTFFFFDRAVALKWYYKDLLEGNTVF
jgi:hypothetical protein